MPGRIITIAQQKGGTGKTTLAAHLAVFLGPATNRRVALLEVDPQGSLGAWFKARERSLGEDRAGLSFHTASGWSARREANRLARDHDFVIVDTPPKSDLEAGPAIEVADLVLVPVQPTPVDLWATEATLTMVARHRRDALLVLSRVPARAALTGEMVTAMAALGVEVAATRLGNRTAFAGSMGRGLTVVEATPGSPGAAEVAALGAELAARLRRPATAARSPTPASPAR